VSSEGSILFFCIEWMEVYDSLLVDDFADYDYFKFAILRAYELHPETYRLSFWNARKRAGDTHVEFPR